MTDLSVPRGIRNNNPGNIRSDGTLWKGLVGDDGAFCKFDIPEHGIRAITRILISYQRKPGAIGIGGPGLDTVREIIERWAPKFENNTEAYIAAVCASMKVSDKTSLVRANYGALIAGIIHHENGEQPYPMLLIEAGITMAF